MKGAGTLRDHKNRRKKLQTVAHNGKITIGSYNGETKKDESKVITIHYILARVCTIDIS